MAAVFPSERGYKFSSSLMNLKFMKKGTDTNQATALPKHSVSGPALTVLESSRREIDARKQLPGTVVIEEEHSITKLFDLVMGRFSFRGINPVLEAALHAMDDSAPEDGEMENTDGKDITDRQMAERSAAYHTVGKKFNTRGGGRGMKRQSDDADAGQTKRRSMDHSGEVAGDRSDNRQRGGRYFTSYGTSDRGRGGRNQDHQRHNSGRGGRRGRGGLPRP